MCISLARRTRTSGCPSTSRASARQASTGAASPSGVTPPPTSPVVTVAPSTDSPLPNHYFSSPLDKPLLRPPNVDWGGKPIRFHISPPTSTVTRRVTWSVCRCSGKPIRCHLQHVLQICTGRLSVPDTSRMSDTHVVSTYGATTPIELTGLIVVAFRCFTGVPPPLSS